MHDFSTNLLAIQKEVYTSDSYKLKKEYFEEQARYYSYALDYPKEHIITARNYYSGKRNTLDFEYLEDIYGLQNPIDLGFTNIIKPRIDALIGLSILSEPDFMVAYTDKETIRSVAKEKMTKIIADLKSGLAEDLKQGSMDVQNNVEGPQAKEAKPSSVIAEKLDKLSKKYGDDYENAYLIGAQHILRLIETDEDINMVRVKKEVSKDYFITGEGYVKSDYMGEGKDPKIRHVLPEELFSDRPRRDRDLKRASVVVVKKRISPHEVLRELGDILKKEEAELLFSTYSSLGSISLYNGDREVNMAPSADAEGSAMDSYYMKTGWSNSDHNRAFVNELVDLYHIEWLASTRIPKEGGGYVYREDRYEVYRIGPDIFVGGRRCDEAPRRQDQPWKTCLSYDGAINTSPSHVVTSLVNSMREIQDLYDIMMFFRNNSIANSGVSGSRVNIAAIPKALGKKFMDRLTKWITIRKQGLELIDPTEEGAQLFQHYGDFNGAVRGDAINAINAVLESLTVQADIISGVPRQMLGVIEQRDAVENVKVGINQVSVLSLEMFRDIDIVLNSSVQGALDNFKYAYRNKGKEGVYRNGMAMIPFVVDPSKFSVVEYKVTVVSSGIENAKLLKVQTLAKELAAQGSVDPDVLIKILNRKSIHEIENVLVKAVAKKKEEMMNMQQLQEQVEAAGKQVQQLEAEIKRLENNAVATEKARLDQEAKIAEREAQQKDKEIEIEDERLRVDETYKKQELVLKTQIVELEKEQLLFGGGNSEEINNNQFK